MMSDNNEEYVDIYSDSLKIPDFQNNNEVQFKKPESPKPPEKKKGIKKAAIIAAVFVLLCGSVAAAALSGMINTQNTPVEAESSAPPVSSAPESSEESVQEESVEEEESGLTYETTGEFKTDKTTFSAKLLKKLDKDVTAKYIVLYDATADKIIYERDSTKKIYPASTTKMLTAIVASKIIPKDTVITVGDEIEMIEFDSSTAGLQKGMKMTYEMLLDALLLPSGNDAAYTIAVNAAKIYTGNDTLSNEEAVEIFMGLVNEAAKGIGCTGTHYVTPDGWHDDDHYTTATDLAKIAAYARTIPLVKASCGKEEVEWELIQDNSDESSDDDSSVSGEDDTESDEDDNEEEVYIPETVYWYNSNAMLQVGSSSYSEYCDGMKTGFTDEAGTSVVASATMDGHTFIAVIMFGETLYKKYDDANILFKEGFKLYGLDYKYGSDYDNA